MSDYAFVAERAKKAFASVARLELALAQNPDDKGIAINLSSMRRVAEQARVELERLAQINCIEVCQYRLVPEPTGEYGLGHVSRSLLEYQNLFTQLYDSFKNGPKLRATFGRDSELESMLDFAYSYSGSLGVILLAKSDRDFFSGNLDRPIEALYQILDINNVAAVRDIAQQRGRAVIKRVHDWSEANARAGFAADIRWTRSDGRRLGQMIDKGRLEHIAGFIEATADTTTSTVHVKGILIAGNIKSRSFLIGDSRGKTFGGHLLEGANIETDMTLGRTYEAEIIVDETYHYATEQTTTVHNLKRLVVPIDI